MELTINLYKILNTMFNKYLTPDSYRGSCMMLGTEL